MKRSECDPDLLEEQLQAATIHLSYPEIAKRWLDADLDGWKERAPADAVVAALNDRVSALLGIVREERARRVRAEAAVTHLESAAESVLEAMRAIPHTLFEEAS